MPARNVVVAQSGGPTCVINNSLRGIVEGCRRDPTTFGTVYAGRFGIEGVLKEELIELSATPGEALRREWEEHDLARLVGLIAGQELGSKAEHLALAAAADRYDRDKVLMVGDAPGDRKAAESNGVLFYPIDPGHEDEP